MFRHKGPRSTGTSIYFLLARPNTVQWHKHLSDEGFYWHAGGRVNVGSIDVGCGDVVVGVCLFSTAMGSFAKQVILTECKSISTALCRYNLDLKKVLEEREAVVFS